MPTVPLYDTPANPDAWHRVRAPGGYEWWHLDAVSPSGRETVTIDFFDGDPFNAAYQAAYARYRRRPTRVVPPVPRDYPGVRVRVNAKILYDSASEPLNVSSDGVEIRMGSNVL